jgi:hypothetical protein
MAINRPDLESRMSRYLDSSVTFKTLQAEKIGPIGEAGRYDPERARRNILARDPFNAKRIVRYALLPLDDGVDGAPNGIIVPRWSLSSTHLKGSRPWASLSGI